MNSLTVSVFRQLFIVPLVLVTCVATGARLKAQEPPSQAMVSDFDGLVALLNRDSVTHQTENDDQYVLIPTEKGGIDSVCIIRWAAQDGFVHFVHRIPVKLPADRVADVETAMMRLNHSIPIPGLGINHESLGMYFRMTVPFNPRGGLSDQEIRAYFSHTLSQSERWRALLTAVVDGKTKPESVLEYDRTMNTDAHPSQQFPVGEMTCEAGGSHWILQFADNGIVKVLRDDQIGAESNYKVTGDRIQFSDITGPLSVPGKAVYRWSMNDSKISFEKITEVSKGREMVLTSGTWTPQPSQ